MNDDESRNSSHGVVFTVEHPVESRPSLVAGFVYGIKSLDLIKIGVAKNVESRLFTIRGHNPHGCELVFKRYTIAPYIYEEKMHELLAAHAVGREWFRVSIEQVKTASKTASLHARRHWKSLSDAYAFERAIQLRDHLAEKFLDTPGAHGDLDRVGKPWNTAGS